MNKQENYNLLRDIINKIDPIGLVDFDTPESLDEYDSEIKEILKEDISTLNKQDLSTRIHKVFVDFFDKELVGSQDKYKLIAEEFIASRK